MKKILLVLMVAAVYVLHQDIWYWKSYQPLILGFLPIGLAYHAAFSFLCAGMMWVLGRLAWPEHLEVEESQLPPSSNNGGGH